VITAATVRATPLPERETFRAVFFPDFESGMAAVRAIVQARLPLSMLRLSTPVETVTTLALAGHARLISALENLLALRGIKNGKCMLILGYTGGKALGRVAIHEALGLAKDHGGVHVGGTFGKQWHKGRFRTPYLRNTLWEAGVAIDTLEPAVAWERVPATIEAIESALHGAIAETGERIHVFTHLSHVYPYGSSIYVSYLFRLATDPDETLRRWQRLKARASQAVVAQGGTITHQHGVGTDHAPYLEAEKGALGLGAIRAGCAHFDPAGIMNPGKLVE